MRLGGSDFIFVQESQYMWGSFLGLLGLLIIALGWEPSHKHHSGKARASPSWSSKNDIYCAYGRS